MARLTLLSWSFDVLSGSFDLLKVGASKFEYCSRESIIIF